MTFGQLHARQPAIEALAAKLGRGANSVAMKLCNFASLDPALKLRGIRGLKGASALDRAVWEQFYRDLNEAVPASEEALCSLFGVDDAHRLEVLPKEGIRVRRRQPTGPTEVLGSVKARRGQDYFRDAVLNNFGGRCGITQLAVREPLVHPPIFHSALRTPHSAFLASPIFLPSFRVFAYSAVSNSGHSALRTPHSAFLGSHILPWSVLPYSHRGLKPHLRSTR